MAANDSEVRELVALGLPWRVAKKLADPDNDTINAAAVPDAADLTAPASMGATYTAANVNALRADVLALQATVKALQQSLRNEGVIAP